MGTKASPKERWAELLNELHAALSGEEAHPRNTASILRDLEGIRTAPDAPAGLSRPCAWLQEWAAVGQELGGASRLERARREWVELGWLPPSAADLQRERDRIEAQERGRADDRRRAEERRRQAENDRKIMPSRPRSVPTGMLARVSD